MGVSAGLALLLSLVRVKFAAVLIGTTGVGLMATYNALVGAIVILLGMGVPAFAVREIALAHGNCQPEKLAAIVIAVKRLCLLLGALGFLLTFLISGAFSNLIFGNDTYSTAIALLSVVVLFTILSNAYASTIQGVRQVGELAKANVLGAIGGTLVTLFCFISMGIDGVNWALIGVATTQFCTMLFFARRLPIAPVAQSWHESATIGLNLLKNGTPLMLSSFAAIAASLIILAMIARDLSLASAGFYSAAAALTSVFFGLLNSVSTDYYPRLSTLNQDPLLMSSAVNEQAEIGLLLTVPGLLTCWVLAPFILEILYSQSFTPATPLLQWFLIGSLARVISLPMGFVLLALGRSKLFLLTEIVVQVVHIILVWIAIQSDSLLQTAIGFCLVYTFQALFIFFLCRKLISFKWSASVKRFLIISAIQFILVSVFFAVFEDFFALTLSSIIVIFSILISVRVVAKILGLDHPIVRKILKIPYAKNWIHH